MAADTQALQDRHVFEQLARSPSGQPFIAYLRRRQADIAGEAMRSVLDPDAAIHRRQGHHYALAELETLLTASLTPA